MHGVRLGPGLLAPLKVEARPSPVRRFHQVEAADVGLTHARVPEDLEDRFVDVFVEPAEREGPESPQLSRLGTGERDVPDVRAFRVRRVLQAEAVPFGVAHDRGAVPERTNFEGLRHDQAAAELKHAIERGLAVRHVDVEVNRHLERLGLGHLVEEQRHVFALRIGGEPATPRGSPLVAEQRRPELRNPTRVVAGEGEVLQPNHEAILSRSPARPPHPLPGWGEHPPPSRSTIPRGSSRVCADFAPAPHPGSRVAEHRGTTRAASRPPSLRLLVGPSLAALAVPSTAAATAAAATTTAPIAVAGRAVLARVTRRSVFRPLDQLFGADGVAVLVLLDQLEANPAAGLVDLLHEHVEDVAAIDDVLDVADTARPH